MVPNIKELVHSLAQYFQLVCGRFLWGGGEGGVGGFRRVALSKLGATRRKPTAVLTNMHTRTAINSCQAQDNFECGKYLPELATTREDCSVR